MSFFKALIITIFLGFGQALPGQTFSQEGETISEAGKGEIYLGTHTWRDENEVPVAEVVHDDQGVIRSFMTWEKGEIMDAWVTDPKQKRFAPFNPVFDWAENGLGMKCIREGNGTRPELGQEAYVRYHARLQDGAEFYNCFDKRKPNKFTLGNEEVIAGFEQAVLQMSVGEMAWVYVPNTLAYGHRAVGSIPPFANLWYKIELVKIE